MLVSSVKSVAHNEILDTRLELRFLLGNSCKLQQSIHHFAPKNCSEFSTFKTIQFIAIKSGLVFVISYIFYNFQKTINDIIGDVVVVAA